MIDEVYRVQVKYEDVNFGTFNDSVLAGVTNMAAPAIVAGRRSTVVETATTATILANGLSRLSAAVGSRRGFASLLKPANAPITAPTNMTINQFFKGGYSRGAGIRMVAQERGMKAGKMNIEGRTIAPVPAGDPAVAHREIAKQRGVASAVARKELQKDFVPTPPKKIQQTWDYNSARDYNLEQAKYRQHMGK